jgi:hypothetical protein
MISTVFMALLALAVVLLLDGGGILPLENTSALLAPPLTEKFCRFQGVRPCHACQSFDAVLVPAIGLG